MKTAKTYFKALSVVLAVLLTVVFLLPAPNVNGAAATKTQKSYDIAVVFDNSGSMYQTEYWCQAKYSMEIFASMLNYQNKDKLTIFPMWEVTTDGSKPGVNKGGSYEAFTITSKDDIDKISNLFTVNPGNTPFEPIEEAYNYLGKSNASEKWLIVLTDGKFNLRGRKDKNLSAIDLQAELSAMASNSIKVHYLGFDKAAAVTPNNSAGLYATNSTDPNFSGLKNELIKICNNIFQRSELDLKYLKGNKLTVDLSMKNLIVFAQGANAKVSSLTDSSGKSIGVTLDSGQRKYSEIKANSYEATAPVDTSLAGQVVTFDACAKGEYTLEFSDTDAIQIFYEPDVDIKVSLVNSDGHEVDASTGELNAGEYTVTSKIVDSVTGEDVTSHPLMGDDLKIKTFVKQGGASSYTEYDNGAVVTLSPDEDTEIYIEGTYLKVYKISTKDDPSAFPFNFKILEPAVRFKINAQVLQESKWYMLKDHENWKPIRVDVTLDGVPATDEQLDDITLNIKTDEGLKCRYEKIPNESAFNIYIASDENGKYVEPKTGHYTIDLKGSTFKDENQRNQGVTKDSVAKVGFDIQKISKLTRDLIIIGSIIFVLAVFFFIMTRKVMPKKLVKDTASFWTISAGDLGGDSVDLKYSAKNRTLSINGPTSVEFDEQCSATLNLKPVDNRFTASKRRRFAVVGISSSCEKVKLASTQYVNVNGQWVKENIAKAVASGRAAPPLEQTLSCNPRFELLRAPGGVNMSTLSCKTKTKK